VASESFPRGAEWFPGAGDRFLAGGARSGGGAAEQRDVGSRQSTASVVHQHIRLRQLLVVPVHIADSCYRGNVSDLGTYLLTSGNTWLRDVTSGERPTIPLGIITLFMNNDNIMSNTNKSTQ